MVLRSFIQCYKYTGINLTVLSTQKLWKPFNLKRCYFYLHQSVMHGIHNLKPVLALESTIITHGMPFPENLRTAIEVEDIVRRYDVIPATIGVIKGRVHVGMDKKQLEELATFNESEKLSRRDLPTACARGLTGGTTVSATLFIAHRCGINIFVTGGIGGVHKMGHDTMDISADLRELGRTPVTVISAGVKSILDIKRTLEYLETESVTVATFGKEVEFPAFFVQSSGISSPSHVENVRHAASLINHHKRLNLSSGILIAVPISNKFNAYGIKIENATREALKEAREMHIEGSKVTPFVLSRVNEMTNGLSLQANIALIKANAEVGAQIAKECFNSTSSNEIHIETSNVACKSTSPVKTTELQTAKKIVVIGACNVDIVSKSTSPIVRCGPSNPAIISHSYGGVGRNIAEVLWRLNCKPYLISAVGYDYNGDSLIQYMDQMNFKGISRLKEYVTGVYLGVYNESGEIEVATEDTDIHQQIDVAMIMENSEYIKNSSFVCVDANISEIAMGYICKICTEFNVPMLFEPTGELKAAKGYMSRGQYSSAIKYMTPNITELCVIYEASSGFPSPTINQDDLTNNNDVLREIIVMCQYLLKTTPHILVTLGKNGVLMATAKISGEEFFHYPLLPQSSPSWLKDPIANSSGTGDSFAAGFVYGILNNPGNLDLAVRIGLAIAQRTLRSSQTVSTKILEEDAYLQPGEWLGRKLY